MRSLHRQPAVGTLGGRLYRYYVSQTVLKHGAGSCLIGRVPAGEIEAAVIAQLRAVFRQPEIVAGTWKAARAKDYVCKALKEHNLLQAIARVNRLYEEDSVEKQFGFIVDYEGLLGSRPINLLAGPPTH